MHHLPIKMPEELSGDKLKWVTQFVSPAMDFIVYEDVTNEAAKRLTPGDAHPQAKYAGYLFAACEPVSRNGQRAYYLKTREEQWKYNAERAQALGDDLPRLSFTWVVLRSTYYSAGTVPSVSGSQIPDFGGTYSWTLTGQRTREMPMPFHGLFIEVIHDYYDTTHPLRTEEIDQETGELRTVTRALVPRTESGHVINASGEVATYEAINSTHGWLVTRKAAGGKGSMVNGRKSIITNGVKPHFWPKVLDYVGLYPVREDSGNIYSAVVQWIVTKKFRCEDYNGPCKTQRVKRYTTKEPIYGGDPAWTSASAAEVSPDIPVPIPLLQRGIDFRGVNLTVQVEDCLRQAYVFYDEGYTEVFPASSPTQWPETIVADVEVYQEDGAWVTDILYVTAPNLAGQSSGLDLTQRGTPGATTFQVAWTPATGASSPILTEIDVALDAEFENAFLTGYRDKTVTPATNNATDTWTEITGLTRGQPYFVRVRTAAYTVGATSYPALTSNTLVIMGKPSPELEARVNDVAVSAVDFGSISLNATGRITLDLAAVGLMTVRGIAAVITGSGDAVFGIADPVSELAAGATSTVELRYSPTALGSIAATLTISSDADDVVISLTGIGIGPEIQVEQPAGTVIANGATVAFGTITTGTVETTFKLRNVGTDVMTGLSLAISGTNAEDWTVTTDLTSSSIAAGAYQEFTLTCDPVESEDAYGARTAVLTITNDDADESPTTYILTATSASPTAPGALDTTFNPNANGAVRAVAMQPDGDVILGGDFTSVGGTTRNRIARVNSDGTLDSGFNPNANGIVRCAIVLPDGTILIGGDFTSIGGTTRNRIALLNADGTLASWYPTGGVDAAVYTMARKSNGAIWIGGPFNTVGGSTRKRIALINSDGTINATNPSVALGISIPAVADVRSIVLDATERLVISGYYFQVLAWGFVARLLADGTVDGSFVGQVYFNGPVNAVAILADGSVVAGGSFTTMNTVTGTFPSITPGTPVYNRANLIVLDSAGVPTADVLDANGIVHTLALQADGRVIIGGAFTTLAAVARLRVARLREDLTLEAAFDPQASNTVLALALQEGGEIVCGGDFTTMGGAARNYAARLLNSAAVQSLTVLDSATVRWLLSGSFPAAQRVTFENDTGSGYAALGGTTAAISGGYEVTGLTLSGTGTLRARSIGTDGHSCGLIEETLAYNVAPEIGVSIGGVAIADAGSYAVGSVRVGLTGDFTVTIQNTGLAPLALTTATPVTFTGTHAAEFAVVSAQPATPVPVGGSVTFTVRFTPASVGSKSATMEITSDDSDEATYNISLTATAAPGAGSADTSWQPVVNANVVALAPAAADVLLGGFFTTVNGSARGRYARLTALNTLVAQTGAGVSGGSATVWSVQRLADGGYIIGGNFTAVNGVVRRGIAKISAAGVLDTAWDAKLLLSTGSTSTSVYRMVLQPDGKLLIMGLFDRVNSVVKTNFVRLNADGTLDAGFTNVLTNTGSTIPIWVQPDGKIYVGYTSAGLVRLLSTGALDPTWTAPTFIHSSGIPGATGWAVQPDGKVIIVGRWTSINGTARTGVTRLTTAGAVDTTFAAGWKADAKGGPVLQADGAVLAWDGWQAAISTLGRANALGGSDASFVPPAAASQVHTVALTANGEVLCGLVTGLQRLVNDAVSGALTVPSAARVQWLRGGTAPEAMFVTLDLSEDGSTWTRQATGSAISGGWEFTALSLPQSGTVRGQAWLPGGGMLETQVVFSGLAVPDLAVTRLVTGGADVAVADDDTLTFAGCQPPAGGSAGQTSDVTLKLRNSGGATLTGLTLTVTGAEFAVTSLDLTTLEAGQTATAVMRFTPSVTGQRYGTLIITSNVPGSRAEYRLNLTGSGNTNPAAITDAATMITATAARLPLRVTANADAAEAWVKYRRAGTSDAWTTTAVISLSGFVVVSSYRDVSGLTTGTSYEFMAVCRNAVSTKEGTLRTFTTT